LLLTAAQVTTLQSARAGYRKRIDALWSGLAQRLSDLPERYDFADASRRMDDTIDEAWELTRVEVRTKYPEILAPVQLAILPGWSNRLFQAERRLHVRLFVQ